MTSLSSDRMAVVWDDITKLGAAAVLTPANTNLMAGGGVNGAIHRAAGAGLSAACRALGSCPIGEARLTAGFGLPADHVIHAVVPVWSGGAEGETALLASCYREALKLAVANDLQAVITPCLGSGAAGFPPELAARIAVHEVATALADQPDLARVTFVAADETQEVLFLRILDQL